jgi:hypothetical protein
VLATACAGVGDDKFDFGQVLQAGVFHVVFPLVLASLALEHGCVSVLRPMICF